MRSYIFISLILMVLSACNNPRQEALIGHAIEAEKHISEMNLAEYDCGEGVRQDVIEEINTTPNNIENRNRLARLSAFDRKMAQIDHETAFLICIIDRFKIRLLKNCGENVGYSKWNQNRILQRKYDPKKPLEPIGLKLSGIESAAETIDDFPVPFLIERIDGYRNKMLKHLESLQSGIKLQDERTRHKILSLLTEDQPSKYNKLPLITVIQQLSLLQNRIYAARKICLKNVYNEISNMASGSMFDLPQALVYGPDVARRGDEIELKVIMASFETGNQYVRSNRGTVTCENNVPVVKIKADGKDPIRLNGTLEFKMRSGFNRTYPWEKTIYVEE